MTTGYACKHPSKRLNNLDNRARIHQLSDALTVVITLFFFRERVAGLKDKRPPVAMM